MWCEKKSWADLALLVQTNLIVGGVLDSWDIFPRYPKRAEQSCSLVSMIKIMFPVEGGGREVHVLGMHVKI